MKTHRLTIIRVTVISLLLSGCSNLGYYSQAIRGHLDILSRRVAIAELLEANPACTAETVAECDDVTNGASESRYPNITPEQRHKLTAILQIRDFASRELALPENASYRSYAALRRPYAVWNVFAAPEFELTAKEWCFPIAGCVSYRGYFSRDKAQRFADKLRAEGYDVYIGGVRAYSTLGWFDDPILDTILRLPESDIAGLIFHELAHQLLYVQDDTAFNESFAMTVELEGTRRWAKAHATNTAYRAFLNRRARHTQVIAVIMNYRKQLEELYRKDMSDNEKRVRKARILSDLQIAYRALPKRMREAAAFDAWFARELNNAQLLSVSAYHEYVPALQVLLRRHRHDLPAFYHAAKQLGELSKQERTAELAAMVQRRVRSTTP